jgi:Na+-driven multidrug efflux pump
MEMYLVVFGVETAASLHIGYNLGYQPANA